MSIYPRIKRLRITLKEWLKNNKHIKTVTRDRASAYSYAIQAILPDAMQIADRFHLHQNLLEAIKNTINSVIPVDVVYTDQIEHTARRFSAWLPPIQCTLSGHQCMMIIQV